MTQSAAWPEIARQPEAGTSRPLPPKPDWPLIGDILTSRIDEPDLLRLWVRRSAQDERLVHHRFRR